MMITHRNFGHTKANSNQEAMLQRATYKARQVRTLQHLAGAALLLVIPIQYIIAARQQSFHICLLNSGLNCPACRFHRDCFPFLCSSLNFRPSSCRAAGTRRALAVLTASVETAALADPRGPRISRTS